MLSLTRKTDYALVALTGLAAQPERRVSAHALAAELRLPEAALRNILKRLTRGGLLLSTQGPSGGYRLAKPASEISLAEVVRQIEGPVRLTACCGPAPADGDDTPACRLEDSCHIKGAVRRVQDAVRRYFERLTVADLAAERLPEVEAGVELMVGARRGESETERAGELTLPAVGARLGEGTP